jgi:hypothetical protein
MVPADLVARLQSMRHPVDDDCQRPAEATRLLRNRDDRAPPVPLACSGTVMSNIVSLPPFSASSIRNFSRSEP